MLVSIVITALNEERYLPGLFDCILAQTYNHSKIEIIFVDSNSTDLTYNLMIKFREEYKEQFFKIEILKNHLGSQASGFNLGVSHSNGDVILKIDAHSTISTNFVFENVKIINDGEVICGGKRPTICLDTSSFSQTLHLLEESIFGSSIANYRKSDKEAYVDSVFHGMYRKEIFRVCGLVNESLGRTEDNEFHYRIRKAGYKIKYSPNIVSYQYIRPTLKSMIKQKYLNGYWIGLTSHVVPKCLSVHHFIPCVFILSLLFFAILGIYSFYPLIFLLSVYFLVVGSITLFNSFIKGFKLTHLLLFILIPCIHISYGIGTLIGLIQGFEWKKQFWGKTQ